MTWAKRKLCVLLVCLLATVANAQWTTWSLTTEEDLANDNASVTARIGYEFGGFEPWIGSVWRPNWQGDSDPPQIMTFGLFYHLDDIVDPKTRPAWLPGILVAAIPAEASATPYIGPQGSFTFIDEDSGTYGLIAGLIYKSKEDPLLELVVEVEYGTNFGALSAVDDGFVLNIGFRRKW